MPQNLTFVCIYISAGLDCHFPEMTAVGVVFMISALVSLFFLRFLWMRSRTRAHFFDHSVGFWTCLAIWQLFYGITSIFSFHWTPRTYRAFSQSMFHILLFIPMFLLILMIIELFFIYRNPGTRAVSFFRWLILIFLVVFILLGITIILCDPATGSDSADRPLALWCGCTDFVLCVGFACATYSLLQYISFAAIQMGSSACVNLVRLGIVIECIIFGIRATLEVLNYYQISPLENWMLTQLEKRGSDTFPNGRAGVIRVVVDLVCDFTPATLAVVAAYLITKQNMLFNDNPYFNSREEAS
jgi:hypothetical protein